MREALQLVALTITALCGVLAGGCKDAPSTRHSPPGPPAPTTAALLDLAAISLDLQTPSTIKPGEAVPLLLVARNDSSQPAYLGTGDSATTFDIRIVDRSGKTVWRRMQNREALASLHEHTIAPGQGLRFADTWDQRSNEGARVPAGIYHVEGILDAQGETDLKTTPKRLEISPQP
ncbi:MAG TPA: BsuPI-related putative proteinase inhibitor [Longimicrobium sp.]